MACTSDRARARRAGIAAVALAGLAVLFGTGQTPVGVAQQEAPRCFGREATIHDTDSQFIVGGADPDVIVVGRRKAVVEGRGGDDRICGGRRTDVIRGGSGSDLISGGKGNDLLVGAGGADRLFGRAGNDTMDGKGGEDYCRGGKGSDLASAGRCEHIRGADPVRDPR